MDKETPDGKTNTSPNPNPLTRFTGTDFCTFSNALREAATEIKGYCLSYKYTSSPDFEAFLISTDEFLEAAVNAWKAIREAIKRDDGTLSIHGMMDKHKID